MSFNKIDITVNGERLEVDLNVELEITDISEGMKKVAAQMAFWGSVWAAAEGEMEKVDAFYRKWRAETSRKIAAANEKLAEWKLKQEVEAQPKFLEYKDAIAKSITNATLARSVFEAFKIKANVLQSKGARERAELDSTGMTTRSAEPTRRRDDDAEERVSAMKDINKKRKRDE